MSRFDHEGDEWFPNQWWLYEANMQRCFSGVAGQQKLREVREALLALPRKRLISTRLADEQGDVCLVGALALHKAEDPKTELQLLAEHITEEMAEWDSYEVEQRTLGTGKTLGLKETMVVELSYTNDNSHRDQTPEERYERVLAWVDSLILEVE